MTVFLTVHHRNRFLEFIYFLVHIFRPLSSPRLSCTQIHTDVWLVSGLVGYRGICYLKRGVSGWKCAGFADSQWAWGGPASHVPLLGGGPACKGTDTGFLMAGLGPNPTVCFWVL